MDFLNYKYAPKGPIPLRDLFFNTKFGFGEGLRGSHPQAKGVLCTSSYEKSRFLTYTSFYLANNTKYGHSYNGRQFCILLNGVI